MIRTKLYYFLLHEQQYILELLELLKVSYPKEKIMNILNEQHFEIIDCSESEILKIKKLETGEIFEKGCDVYYKKYNKWIKNIYFDYALLGSYIGDSFYKNYVRADSGLYSLSEISISDKEIIKENPPEEIIIGGVTYVVKH